MRILIVEDEPPIAEYIEKCTRSLLGMKIQELKIVYTFNDALEYLRKNGIDLCLLDLNLSGKDGFELLNRSVSKPFKIPCKSK